MSQPDSPQLEPDSPQKAPPEVQMWCCVLQLAVLDAEPWITNNPNKTYEQRYYGKFAMMWLMSESRHPGSFRWICDLLGVDRRKIRRNIGITNDSGIW